MSYLKTEGLVIKEINTGEADKIITIFTKKKGKITASAKGARRPKSNISAGSQLLSYNEYVLFSGKQMYVVNSSEVIEPFYGIRNDIVKLTYASHLLSLVLDTVQENQPSPKILSLLLNCLHFLSASDKDPALIARIFEMRLMALSGFAPFFKGCAVCGKTDAENYDFSFTLCGLVCRSDTCRQSDPAAVKLSSGVRKAISHIIYSTPDDLFKFSVSPEVLKGLEYINRRYLRERLEKDYNKLDMLKSIGE
jgi:DNA repair protein RecO (recombination protein O)